MIARLASVLCALVLIAAGALAPGCVASDPVRRLFVDDRFAEVKEHETIGLELSRRWLLDQHAELGIHLRTVSIAFGVALLVVALARRRAAPPRWIEDRLAVPLLAALLVAGVELVENFGWLGEAARRGLLVASPDERRLEFYGNRERAARLIRERVPSDARILVIDFATPGDVQDVTYLVLPRRTYALPRPAMRFDVDRFRTILREKPEGLAWCRDEGYSHAVDLRRLLADLDPTAIVPLEEEREE